MFKRILSSALALTMALSLSSLTFAQESNGDKTVNFENGVETFEDYVPSMLRSAEVDSEPYTPVGTRAVVENDVEATANFESAGLIKENGDFDWDAFEALPTLDDAPSTRSVLGRDNRYEVRDTSDSPYRYVAYILMKYGDESYRGTAFVSGRGIVTTAAHCVYNSDRGGWADSVTIMLQKDGYSDPYGATVATRLRSTTGWTQRGERESDWAVLETRQDLSRLVGYTGLKGSSDLVGEIVEVPGYPGTAQGESTKVMWTDTGEITRQDSVDRVYYKADTSGGNSGGPVFVDGAYAVAVHAYGGSSVNSGARITGRLYSMIREYH